MTDYASASDEWELLSVSPLEGVRLPIGVLRWKIESPGHAVSDRKGSLRFNFYRQLVRHVKVPDYVRLGLDAPLLTRRKSV